MMTLIFAIVDALSINAASLIIIMLLRDDVTLMPFSDCFALLTPSLAACSLRPFVAFDWMPLTLPCSRHFTSRQFAD